MYFKKNLIVIREKKNENAIHIKFKTEKLISCLNIISLRPNIDIAPKVGIENKNDILAASNLLNSRNLAAVIVIPDLLTPGINERI